MEFRMNYKHIFVLFASFVVKGIFCLQNDPDEHLNTTMLIRSKGYPGEDHDVITDDGYILTIQRIPTGRNSKTDEPSKTPILLQHGLLDASSTWVLNFPNQSLGFILADAGYDVWLGNMRGNTYGLRHVNKSITPKTDVFWDFSWDDMAKSDLPSMINYILKLTNQEKLFYIGHSQGTMIGFSQFSQNTVLASKVKLFIALGPVATVGSIESPVRYFAGPTPATDELFHALFGRKDFMPNSQILDWLADKVCKHTVQAYCENIIFLLCGPSKYMNQSRIPVVVGHDPAGTSVKNILHFTQMVYSKQFQMFNYGSIKDNMIHYNQTTPPLYDITQVKLPVALFSATNDWLADPADVQFIRKNLPNIVYDQVIDDWDHLDFLWALDATQIIYYNILNLLKKHN